jgi:Family of unknown function (DUF6184)
MRLHHAIGSLAFGFAGVTAACASNPPPSSPGVTSAQMTDGPSAAARLSDATCKHAAACNEIGGSKTYVSRDACMSETRGKLENALRSADCPRGVDTTRLNACLSEVAAESCTGVGSGFGRMMSCKTGALCP